MRFSPFSKGEMLSVFFILCFSCLVRCLLSFFAVLLFLGSLFEKIFRERTFVFGWWCWSCVFWWVFAYVFAFFWRFAPESVWKNSLDVRSGVFWVRSLFLWFFSPTSFFAVFLFFLRETVQVVTGHPLTRTCFACSFFFLCPAAFVCFARFGRASCFLVVFRGAILGPVRFWDSPCTF